MAELKRILLTGASGFLGARTAEMLTDQYTLALLLRHPEAAWRIQALLPNVTIIKGELNAPESYADAVRQFRPDALLHMAWNGVDGHERNKADQAQNIRAGMSLLEVALASGAKHFIGIGSQAEYGPQNRKLDETAPELPTTSYGKSKLNLKMQAEALCSAKGARFAWVRIFSTYGPRDNPSWLIPSLILKLAAGEKMSLTPGEQLWDFLFVDDAVAALVAILKTSDAAGIFNLGSGLAVPLRETIMRLRDLVDPHAVLGFGDIAYRPDQVMHLEADITRLTQKTAWHPKIALEDGLKRTVAWFVSTDAGKRHVS